MLQRIHWLNTTPQPLWNAQRSKLIEQQALSQPQHPSLMERAGLAIAQLACAMAPHARQAWVLCGPGTHGGTWCSAASPSGYTGSAHRMHAVPTATAPGSS